MKRLTWISAIALVALVAASPAPAASRAKVGKAAPAFTITTFDKRKVSFEELKGKVVVINHWATWCGPCKAEMPMMSAVHARYQRYGFEIFGVTTEDSVPARKLKEVSEALSYPLARAISGGGYPILKAVPTTYIIDRSGVVRYAKAGAFEAQEFIDLVTPLLREPAPN